MHRLTGKALRKAPVFVALIGGAGLSASLLVVLSYRNESLARNDLRDVAHERVEILRTQFLRSLEVLHSVAAFYAARPEISRSEFHTFVAGALARQPELQALAWDARVPRDQRQAFEQRAEADGFPGFGIIDENPDGTSAPSPERDEYFPVFYLEPLDRNRDAFGFDVGSELRRREALEKARDTGEAIASAPIRLAQDKAAQVGILVFQPLYRGDPRSVAERRASLTGFAVAVFRTGDLIGRALRAAHAPGYWFTLVDEDAGEKLYEARQTSFSGLEQTAALEVAGRKWRLQLRGGPTRSGAATPWIAFAGGLAMTALLAAYLLQSQRHAANVALANSALRLEVAVRKEAEAAAEAANRAKSDFLANMSHEIRTPMNAILGYTQILARDAGLHPFQRDAIGTIGSSCDHLLHVIDDILDLSRIDAGRSELTEEDFDVAGLARELIGLFQHQCEEKRLGLRYEGPPGERPLYLYGDGGKLRQVLINLLGNAVKFTERGRIVLRVSSCEKAGWLFEVEDTGIGIAPEAQGTVFEPFSQVPSGTRRGGTGLGLTIAQRQVELMGSRLNLTSTPGEGSRFFFTLSLPAIANPFDATERSATRAIERLEAGCHVRALVVDDIPENREVLAIMLRIVGCEVALAENGRQAVESVRLGCPDIVFMDMRLGDGDGMEIARQLVHEYGFRGLKIVATSASALTHQRDGYLRAGCDDFVAKPFRAERIYAALEQLLGVRFVGREVIDDGSKEIINLGGVALPEELATRLTMAAELHSATVLKSCLNDVENLGPGGARLAQHLRGFLASYDMDIIQRIVAQIPVQSPEVERSANAA